MAYTKVWAHRGASGYAPENTLEAFQMAVDMGADGVELDVQLTKDGKLVVVHDETIGRVSNGQGWVKDYTLSELKQFNFNKTHVEFTNAKIPTLEEVYSLLKNTDLFINVELKTGVVFYEGIEKQVLALARKMNVEDRVLYSSFNHYSVMNIKKMNPEAKTGFLYMDGFINVPEYGKRMGVDALHPILRNIEYPDLLENCREYKLAVHVWTVDRGSDMRKIYEYGIDAFITNLPDKARRIVDEIEVEFKKYNA